MTKTLTDGIKNKWTKNWNRMMSKIFKDEDGKEYELSDFNGNGNLQQGEFVIKPKKPGRYWSVWFQPDGEDKPALHTDKYTDYQAKAITTALEAWLFYLVNPKDVSGKKPSYETDMDHAIGLSINARRVIQQENQ